MKQKIKKVVFLFLLIFIFVTINTIVFADVGSFETYDSDWGGSDWDDSDWDGTYHGGSDWGSDWHTTSTGGVRHSTGTYDMSFGAILNFLFFVILLIIVSIKLFKHYCSPLYMPRVHPYRTPRVVPDREPEIHQGLVEEQLKVIDELFTKEEFNQKAKMLFVKMQNAWTDRNWEEIRAFETDELFEQHKTQIDGYIRNNTINVMDRICILYSKLLKFEQAGGKDFLYVVIKSRMSDYIIDATTKKVIKGNKEIERIRYYKLEFIRKTGIKTKPDPEGLNSTNCPNCGAPTKVTSSGQCEYCKSIITNGDFGWVLNNLEPLQF